MESHQEIAREILLQLLEGFRALVPEHRVPSSAEILRELLDELKDLGRTRRTRQGLQNSLKIFLNKFPRLEFVDDADLVVFLRDLSARVGPRRRDNVLSGIVQLSRFARRRGYLPEDRRSAAEKIRRIKPSHDIETWTPAEARLLLEYISPRWVPCVALGLFAGLRTSEIWRLEWGAVKFDQRVIAVSGKVARKTRVSRIVPMSDNLREWLEPYRGCVGLLYPGNQKTTENLRAQEMQRIRSASGLPRRDNANRHSFGSYRLALTKNIAQVALELGNSPGMVRDHYNNPQTEADAIAYFALRPPRSFEDVIVPLPLEFGDQRRQA